MMKILSVSLLLGPSLCLAASQACSDENYPGTTAHPPQSTTELPLADGRKAWVHIPGGAAFGSAAEWGGLPVVIDFPGWGNSAYDQLHERWNLTWPETADENGFIVVVPEGLDEGTGYQSWNDLTASQSPGPTGEEICDHDLFYDFGVCYNTTCSDCDSPCTWTTCNDDVAFVADMIDTLKEKFCVDPSRIYITGMSNGAMFVYTLMKNRPDLFAAAVPCSGLPHYGFSDPDAGVSWVPVDASETVPLLHLHGRWDQTIPPYEEDIIYDYYDEVLYENATTDYPGRTIARGFYFYEAMEPTTARIANAAGCGEEWLQYDGIDAVAHEEDNMECRAAAGCPDGEFTGFCLYDAAHWWPRKYTDVAWEFMKKFRLPETRACEGNDVKFNQKFKGKSRKMRPTSTMCDCQTQCEAVDGGWAISWRENKNKPRKSKCYCYTKMPKKMKMKRAKNTNSVKFA